MSSVPFGRNCESGTFSAVEASSGTMSAVCRISFESWLSMSKVRMVSISLPKKSMRKGSSLL